MPEKRQSKDNAPAGGTVAGRAPTPLPPKPDTAGSAGADADRRQAEERDGKNIGKA